MLDTPWFVAEKPSHTLATLFKENLINIITFTMNLLWSLLLFDLLFFVFGANSNLGFRKL